MEAIKIVLLVELLIVLILFLAGNRHQDYKEFVARYGQDFQLTFLAPASLFLLDKFDIMEKFSDQIQIIHEKIIRLYGSLEGTSYTRMFLAQAVSAMLVVPFIVTMLAAIAHKGPIAAVIGLILGPLVAWLLVEELDKKIMTRENAIIMELPEFLNKLVLLVNAGETVQEALKRSVQSKLKQYQETNTKKLNPIYAELQKVLVELQNNRSFQETMEDFNKRCAVHEVSIFTSTVLLNYRRGGGDFAAALKELSRTLWEKRIAVAKILGEEASSKLVFPMIGIFIVVLVVIASPAVMSINK